MKSEITQFRKEMDDMGSLGWGIFEEGVEETKIEIAFRMRKRGDAISDIADALDVSEKQIKDLLELTPA
ncbi:MAG: hypothetical protein LUE29_05115 [Lachnospiraceae bacterium]|nr:hypothetical protein [Lachnospiraceae bacterium]